ncbi:cytoplasmic aspartyl-tRNA synthetase (macronuclear) [Tetrahymena thermophila SB210]|uniref:aspartate--tRNA ligase n=1 Tax=Tetrahymena thermophila (strain SB210) TaxID=312017 RepID=Q232M3_TETTS|nr:cytoplasmic aspartyl-tRNA synthetase [Tetrahymena thermophila SB210]EAR91389.1 cytoplasmic aspartyl-tRNA synthetase [Tetrahymena thermophila SB210]|eukprot:XP_001011634.1 cytoplasmic aspartyl-tRNA synthetase [Tetrahymena thermophila SB210]
MAECLQESAQKISEEIQENKQNFEENYSNNQNSIKIKLKQNKLIKIKNEALQNEEKWVQELNDDSLKENYGDYQLVQSLQQTNKKWIQIKDIDDSFLGKNILIRGRLHNLRIIGNCAFLIVRQQSQNIQVVAQKQADITSKTMIKWIKKIHLESIIDIHGIVQKPNIPINCASSQYEICLKKIFVVSRSSSLNYGVADIQRIKKKSLKEISDENEEIDLEDRKAINNSFLFNTINKVIDLRTSAQQAIFRLKSSICQMFRENLLLQGFIEIHTPKIIQSFKKEYSDSFSLDYFGIDAQLSNFPKFYSQMAIQSDFERVFEIGPIYRKLHGRTHHTLCEFIGMNLEMEIKESYQEVIDIVTDLLFSIFLSLEMMFQQELQIVKEYFPSQTLKIKKPVLQISFQEACSLLGEVQNQMDYLDNINQVKLSKIISQKYDTDFYIITQFPSISSNFMDIVCDEEPNYTYSYKFFLRNGEIASGSQRNHDPLSLEKRALQYGIDINSIKKYIDVISYGAYPHGGCCIGLERLILYYLDLQNIRKASLFSRDSKTINP